jgi:uncharacterized protein DUF2569
LEWTANCARFLRIGFANSRAKSTLRLQPLNTVLGGVDDRTENLKGLNGWLILVGIGVVLGPVRLLFEVTTLFYPIFTDGTWQLLTNANSEQFIPYFGVLIISEVISNTLIILASLYLIVLFFRKRRAFPTVYITIVLLSFLFILLDAWVVTFIFPEIPMFDSSTLHELGRGAGSLVIWVPYMLVSKRVKATFIEPEIELPETYQTVSSSGSQGTS